MPKSKLSAVLSLVLVFVSGALVGVLSHRAYTLRAASAAAPSFPRKGNPGDWRKHVVPEMREQLKLDEPQTSQLNTILDEVDSEFAQVRSKWNAENEAIQKGMVDRINAMLCPDQRELYEKWRAEREAERQRRRAQSPGGPPPPRDSRRP